MIVTITLNPAIDKSSSVEKLIPEKKLRCKDMLLQAGGGGINVSKGIHELGGESLAIFTKGGLNGQILENTFKKEGIAYKTIPIESETRENIMIMETGTNAEYRFIMPGGDTGPELLTTLESMLNSLPQKPSYIIASGSLPPGLPEDAYAQIAGFAKKLNAKYIIDTSGKPLELALQTGVYLAKPNINELARLSGKEELQLNEVDDAALELIQKRACEIMVVSLGPSGALLVTKEGAVHIPSPTVKKKSTVGAGDSMVAGIVWMLDQGKTLEEVVRFGIACGTAATMNAGLELFKKADVIKLHDWINKNARKYQVNLEND